jgi:uncharacterized LabA/DUF88 family protein
MRRVIFFIDGFNLYHALDHNPNFHKYKWLNLSKLAKCYVKRKDKIVDIYYFTALATWSQSKVKKHKTYIKALELEGVKVVYGKFKKRDKKCQVCKRNYRTYEEKETDVNIATKLFQLAIEGRYDIAIIITGDSDLLPAIDGLRATFPGKEIGVVIPIGRRAEDLKASCDFHMKMKEKHLRSSLFPETINFGTGQKISCPPTWK